MVSCSSGDRQFSSASAVITEIPGYDFKVKMDVGVVDRESFALGHDPVDAYRFNYQMRFQGPGLDETIRYAWWVVPYIGVVKDTREDYVVELTSFAIAGGTLSEPGDIDDDGLSDYREFFTCQTHWQCADTDGDGRDDGAEVAGVRDPLVSDPERDVNMDCALDLKDAILVLRILAAEQGLPTLYTKCDVNGDEQIGLEELSFIRQKLAGLR
jgi:hypothetical protein